jgi:hypothetical protein
MRPSPRQRRRRHRRWGEVARRGPAGRTSGENLGVEAGDPAVGMHMLDREWGLGDRGLELVSEAVFSCGNVDFPRRNSLKYL